MGDQPFLPIPEFDLDAMTAHSIEVLRTYAPKDGSPYYGCFSGGKDSIVIKELAKLAGVPVTWYYNMTTIDPPELIRYIRAQHQDVVWVKPRYGNFFHREEYKEACPPKGVTLIMGIRAAESSNRARRWKELTFHRRTRAWAVAPIITWHDSHVWDFIHGHGLSYCTLYDEGFHRLGCIGCPMARSRGRRKEFERWPKFERNWKMAFKAIWEKRAGSPQRDGREWFGSARFNNWEEMWEWWLSDDPLPGTSGDGQCQLDMWS